MATDFERYEAELRKKKKWFAAFGVLLVIFIGLWGVMWLQVESEKAQALTKEEVRVYRNEYTALFNEMVGELFQDKQFFSAGFGKGYPKGHAWAAKVDALDKRYEGRPLISATYNQLCDSALLPKELWMIAHEAMSNKSISPAINKQLDQMEFNLRMGDVMNVVERKLPGVDKYRSHMLFQNITAPSPYFGHPDLPEKSQVIWLQLKVPEDDTIIPKKYRAWGHTLYVGLVADGSALVLRKTPTKAVFLDKVVEHDGHDLVVSLR